MEANLLAALRMAVPGLEGEQTRFLNGQLVLTTDAATHARVGQALSIARNRRSWQVMIEARLVRLSDDLHIGLPDDLRVVLATATLTGSPVQLDETAEALIVQSVMANQNGSQLTTPRVTLFDGQKAVIEVRQDVAYVKSHRRVTDKAGKAGYEPDIDVVRPGVTLRVQARLAPGWLNTAVAMQFEFSQLLKMNTANSEGGRVQIPDIKTQRVEGVYTLSRNEATLIHILDVDGRPEPEVLLLKATPIYQREIEDAKGLEGAKEPRRDRAQ